MIGYDRVVDVIVEDIVDNAGDVDFFLFLDVMLLVVEENCGVTMCGVEESKDDFGSCRELP